MEHSDILSKPINALQVSQVFKKGSEKMGFDTLKEIIDETQGRLMENKNFNYVWFGELVDILTAHNLLHLLQPTQGNSRV